MLFANHQMLNFNMFSSKMAVAVNVTLIKQQDDAIDWKRLIGGWTRTRRRGHEENTKKRMLCIICIGIHLELQQPCSQYPYPYPVLTAINDLVDVISQEINYLTLNLSFSHMAIQ